MRRYYERGDIRRHYGSTLFIYGRHPISIIDTHGWGVGSQYNDIYLPVEGFPL